MNSPLEMLKGLVVTKADIVHDYVQLAFGESVGLSIYNEMSLAPKSNHIGQLKGKCVKSVSESEESIVITFTDGMCLIVDMHPVAYRGPEALQLNRRGEPPVIWN